MNNAGIIPYLERKSSEKGCFFENNAGLDPRGWRGFDGTRGFAGEVMKLETY
jgi:hypothetical protein